MLLLSIIQILVLSCILWNSLYLCFQSLYLSSVQSLSCVWLWPHGLQHARPPCPSPTPRAYSNSCPSSKWCHPTISSSVVLFSFCLQPLPALGSFSVSQFFASGGQSIGVSASASILLMHIQDWSPLGLTGLISLQSKSILLYWTNNHFSLYKYIKLWCSPPYFFNCIFDVYFFMKSWVRFMNKMNLEWISQLS